MADIEDIVKLLKRLGLSEAESSVYLSLLQNGRQTVVTIGKRVNIPRTTVYRLLDGLAVKKFVKKIVKSKSTMFEAVTVDDLDFVVTEQEDRLNTVSSSLDALKQMEITGFVNAPDTQVRHYQGRSGMRQMLWNSLKADGEIIGYSEFGRVNIVGRKFYNSYVDEFNLRSLSDRAISNENGVRYVEEFIDTDVEKHQLDLDGVRFITKEKFYVAGDTSLYNNTYAVCFWNKGEIVGVEIENSELVKLHKSIFEILWEGAASYDEFTTP